jgi:diguanylate cyclase (GGDEF)-like protein/PAS domain S-box-containing protein
MMSIFARSNSCFWHSVTIDIAKIGFIGLTHPAELKMGAYPKRRTASPDESKLAALAGAATESGQAIIEELNAANAELRAQVERYRVAIDNISPGVCFFDASERLILCNRRYAEIYRLRPDQVSPGTTLREIAERRVAAGTSPMSADDYQAFCAPIKASKESKFWAAKLPNGRTIHVYHQPMPDGGWVSTHEDVTELQNTRAIADERISLQTLIDLVPDYLWVKDADSRFVIVNKALAVDTGRGRTANMIGLSDVDIHSPEAAQGFRALELEILTSGQPMIDEEEHVVDAKGADKWLSSTKVPLRNQKNEIIGLVGAARDITARKLANALRDGQAHVLEMIATSAPLISVLDRLIRVIESQLTGIFGSVLLLDEDELHLRHGAAPSLPEDYLKAIDGARIGPNVGSCGSAAYRRETVVVADIALDPLWKDYRELAGKHGLRSCWSTPIMSSNGAVLGVFAMYSASVRKPGPAETRLVEVATRIAGIAIERKLAEDRIHFMATHDALTGLPNRGLLRDRLAQALLLAERYNRWATVAFIDLDNFKVINDSLGHNAGDELLKILAGRMVSGVRASDTVVRFGGDEFVILFFDQEKSAQAVSQTLQNIQAAIAAPLEVEGHSLRVTSSIGVATYPNDGKTADELLANADAAMYRAKEIGRNNFQYYTPELNEKVHEKFKLQEELRNAVARNEFSLLYQPQINLRSGKIFAVEALIRWNHPESGLLSPDRFIPIAEETGLIVQIGEWVLKEACRQNKAWQDAGLPPIGVCVNVSARQFTERGLPSLVATALSENKLEARYLELEVTESLIMQDADQAIATMMELQTLGVQLSIDDFGTGYSSLIALKTFPVGRLKIDKSFIGGLPNDENDKAVATAVISMGQKLNLRVIAEGVETAEQVSFLRENNCDEMQGYYFSKPMQPCAIEELLQALLK